MEISVQNSNALKIKGKHASVFINPQDKTANYNMAIILGNSAKSSLKIRDDVVIIDGPGEYEAGGIKVSGIKADTTTVYSINIDNLDLVLGNREGLEKIYQKLKEHNVALIYSDTPGNVSFATGLGMNSILFFGDSAKEAIDSLAKEGKKELAKYTIASDKLPAETETVLLASSS